MLTALIESNLNSFQVEKQKQMFGLVSQAEGDGLFVNYNNDKTEELRAYDSQEVDLPRFMKAESDLMFHVYENTYITLSEGADVRVIIFNKNRIHLSLIEGELILDNRLSAVPSSVQVKNTLLKPYERGVFRIKADAEKIELASIEGQSLIGIYEQRELTSKHLLSRNTELKFEEKLTAETFTPSIVTTSGLTRYAENKLLLDADKKIETMDLFSSKYKGKQVAPEKNRGVATKVTKSLTFNNKKKQFLSLYPYQQNLLRSAALLSKGAVTEANVLITDANAALTKELAKNPSSINSFKLQLSKDYEAIAGLSSINKLNPLKENIENEYQTYIKEEFYLENTLSLLNDAFILFKDDLNVSAEEKIQSLSKNLSQALSDEDRQFIIDIIDNLVSQNPEANFKAPYALRQSLFDSVKNKAKAFEVKYREQTDSHIDRLKTYSSKKQISTGKIKESALVLIDSLDTTHQLKHEDFIDDLNIQGIQLGF